MTYPLIRSFDQKEKLAVVYPASFLFDSITTVTTLVVAILGATGKLPLPPAATYSLFAVSGTFITLYLARTSFVQIVKSECMEF